MGLTLQQTVLPVCNLGCKGCKKTKLNYYEWTYQSIIGSNNQTLNQLDIRTLAIAVGKHMEDVAGQSNNSTADPVPHLALM